MQYHSKDHNEVILKLKFTSKYPMLILRGKILAAHINCLITALVL